MAPHVSDEASILPWAQLMKFGIGQLRLSPSQFWQMTLREVDAAILFNQDAKRISHPPQRHSLNALIRDYPDNL
mgnify:CR=1 FL=1